MPMPSQAVVETIAMAAPEIRSGAASRASAHPTTDRRARGFPGSSSGAPRFRPTTTAFPTRWKLLRERVEAMKAIWREDEAEYHGDLVRFEVEFL